MNKKSKKIHESYAENELKQKKDLEQKFKELLEKANGRNETGVDSSQALQEENRLLSERLLLSVEKLRISEEGKENELRQKKDLEQKLKELLEKANGSLISAE